MTGDSSRLAIHGGLPLAPSPIRFQWPVMTDRIASAVATQLREATSLYDRSGIVGRFEDAFAGYSSQTRTLAVCSGTAALHSLYYGSRLGAGDEVICSDYGFFATITPLLHLGVRLVLVDSTANGTIDVAQIESACTVRTKAVVATHMWGQPADVVTLRRICDDRGLLLFEDCSHAYDSRIGERVVGSFGDGAAWSMQAKKTLCAGEGGVLATNNEDIFERALLLGHFNQRALRDIRPDSGNARYAFTGTGLKYRAHPLALAMALAQLDDLAALVDGRQEPADMICAALNELPGVRLLSRSTGSTRHSYYSLVALFDPAECGYAREQFVAALRAENIRIADVPLQMRSMHHYPLVQDAGFGQNGYGFSNSLRITGQALKFFIPSVVSEDSVLEKTAICAEAIRKVGRGLAAGRA